MRKLDILVPIYNEDENIIKPLFDSIAIQQNVDLENDIGIIVCCDGGSARLSGDFINKYFFPIEFYVCEHKGVSATRNACLDKSTAEYVMFCDCDDMFYNACGLWILFQEMKQGFDSLISIFVEETRNPENKDEVLYINHEMDTTFVHGKVHRRQYLIDKNIRWDETLTIHEDSYFNILCQGLSENIKYSMQSFYLWKWREDSVCRHDPKYILKTYNNLLDSNEKLIQEFLRRNMKDKATFFTVFMIFDAYYTMNKDEWLNQENQEYRAATEKRFSEWFEQKKNLWESMPIGDKMLISNDVRSRNVMEGMKMEAITIDAWLEHIQTLRR